MTTPSLAPAARRPVLELEDLRIDLYTETASVRAIDDATLQVHPGEILAIVGESGSGKTVLTLGTLGLLPEGVSIVMNGTARCCGYDLIGEKDSAREILRRGQAGVVFQDPISALNPMKRIGPQICAQTVRLRKVSKSDGRRLALELLRRTGIPDPEDRYNRYPHEMSGGMLQRAMIALALAGKPHDHPSTRGGGKRFAGAPRRVPRREPAAPRSLTGAGANTTAGPTPPSVGMLLALYRTIPSRPLCYIAVNA